MVDNKIKKVVRQVINILFTVIEGVLKERDRKNKQV